MIASSRALSSRRCRWRGWRPRCSIRRRRRTLRSSQSYQQRNPARISDDPDGQMPSGSPYQKLIRQWSCQPSGRTCTRSCACGCPGRPRLARTGCSIPAAARAPVRVRDRLAEAGAFAADVADGSHIEHSSSSWGSLTWSVGAYQPTTKDAERNLTRIAAAGYGNQIRGAKAPDPPTAPGRRGLISIRCLIQPHHSTQRRSAVADQPATAARLGASSGRRTTAARSEINELNVFPIPDSDTGSNMAFTMNAAADGAEAVEADAGWRR